MKKIIAFLALALLLPTVSYAAYVPLPVNQGGTGAPSYTRGLIFSSGGTNVYTSTSSPVVPQWTATSTTASSTAVHLEATNFLTQTIQIGSELISNFSTSVKNIFSGLFTVNGLVKGNGSGTYSAAVSGTDYAPATSGSGILKGNGSGGFSIASAGTDYLSPTGSGTGLTGVALTASANTMSGANNFTATNTFSGIQLGATSGNNMLKLTPGQTYSSSVTVGGAFNLVNTSNDGAGFVLSSSHGSGATSRLMVINETNSAFDQDMIVASSSANNTTALNLKGVPTGKGILKIEHMGNTGDANGSAISVDLQGSGTAAQGFFMDATNGGTTGPLFNVRNAGTQRLLLTATGTLTVNNASSTGAMGAPTVCISTDCRTSWPSTGGTGTVTSVDMTVPTGLSVSGNPITTSGTLALTLTSGYNIPTTASTTNFNVAYNRTDAMFIVSSSTSTGDYNDIQTAINALPSTGGTVFIKCGTYVPASTIKIKVSGTVIKGSGICTKIEFDNATSSTGLGFSATGLTNTVIQDLWIHQRGVAYSGVGIDASNTPILYVNNVKIDNTATSTRLKATADLTFYQHWSNLDLRDNKTCMDISGNPVNANSIDNVRCAPTTGQRGGGFFVDANNSNGAQTWKFDTVDIEPNGSGQNNFCFDLRGAVSIVIINAHCEGAETGITFASLTNTKPQRVTVIGGEFASTTMPSDSSYEADSITFINSDVNSTPYTKLAGNTIVQPTGSNFETGTPALTLKGNTNFAQATPLLKVQMVNSSDTSTTTQIINPGGGVTLETRGAAANDSTKGTCFIAKNVGGNTVSYFWFEAGTMKSRTTPTCSGTGTTTIDFH